MAAIVAPNCVVLELSYRQYDPSCQHESTHAGTNKDRNEEKHGQEGHIPDNRTKSDNGDSQQSWLEFASDSERLDKEITDDKQDSQADWTDNLSNDNRLPWGPWYITRELLGWKTQSLSLETGDSRSRQSTVADPRVGVGSRISSGHPSKEFSVVDDKVAKGELVGIEQERSDTETGNREPEVDQVRHKDGKGDVEQQHEGSHSQVDGRTSKSGAIVSILTFVFQSTH